MEQGSRPSPNPTEESLPGHNIVATVYLECGWADPKAKSEAMKAVPEVGMAQAVAKSSNNLLCTGIVGHVPLLEGAEEVRPALAAMVEQFPNMRGIRDSLACREGYFPFNTTTDMAYDDKFRSSFALLSEFNLTYDTWLYHDNLPALRDLALAFPETTIICDHVGSPVGFPPSDPETTFKEWAPSIKELADRCPNVMVKLSGLGMPVCGFGFEKRPVPPTSVELAEAWRPYVLHCIECFGVDRCMFASNFPVDKVSCSYTALFNSFKIIVKDFPVEDKKKLFHDNAVRIYRLQIR
jgi:predicted TIM-barrel fold metal-dependent hydrolase